MHSTFVPNRNNVTHRKSRNYDRINAKGFASLTYRDPINVANGKARRAANVEVRLIKGEQTREFVQDIWDAIAARDAARRG
jgi:hypothetical protein